MQHMRDTFNFNPSKRAFQQQFRRWGFPSKQNPAHRNPQLVERVKELWEANYTQRDMLTTLEQEGFEIKERELMRLRAKHRWLLRIPNGMKQADQPDQSDAPTTTEELSELQAQIIDAAEHPVVEAPTDDAKVDDEINENTTNEELQGILRKRKELHDQRQHESDEKWAAKKRRRRTKGYAGLPADPPGPPRFPSETTLDESKVILNLSTKEYRELRDQFQAMCEAEGVVKKTLAGTEKWTDIKNRLIQANEPLQRVFYGEGIEQASLQPKELALDVIATDVTKRIRSIGRRMTIVEAKNTLGVNPEQSRQIRNAFYVTLQQDKFTSKLETGDEHWNELKAKWVADSSILQNVFAQGEEDPQYKEKQKALEALCRDVMKRLRDDQAKGKAGTKPVSLPPLSPEFSSATAAQTAQAASALAAAQAPDQATAYQFASAAQDLSDLPLDPSLLEAVDFATVPSPVISTPVYIRPHPKSQVHGMDKMWLASMDTRTVNELRRILARKWPNAQFTRIDGVEKGADGQEISYLIEEDDELDAYLDHVNGRKATFVVQLGQPLL
jgi:hypothetical protein